MKFVELKKLYNIANEAKNAVKNIVELSSKAASGNYSKEETQTHANNIKPAADKFERIENNAKGLPSTQKVVELYRKELKEKQQAKPIILKTNKPIPSVEHSIEPQLKPSTKPTDILAPLDGEMTLKEIFLIRRVFKAFTEHCPESNKKLIEELKIMVVKELAKK